MPKRKQFEELTIQDDFMFCKVMQNMNICKKVLELVLKEDISIKKITSQKTIENNSEIKAVRLDVLVEDEDNNNIDVEMQMVNNDKIPQRMRLYQANIDVYGTSKGIPYAEMPNTIIMFFCMFDPVGEGLPIYTFENICRENKEIALNDGTLKVIVNVKAYEKVENPELKNLLKYICDGTVTNSLTKEIDMNISEIKRNAKFAEEYMSFCATLQDERAEGIREGMQRGKKEGRREGIKEGRREENINTARRMKKANCDIAFIEEMTGLSQKEIEAL